MRQLYPLEAQEVVRQAKKTTEVRKVHHSMNHFVQKYVSGMHVVMIDGSHFQSSSRRCCVMQGREWFKPLKQACGPELKKPKFKRKSKEEKDPGKILSLTHRAVGFDIAVRSCMDGCWF